MEDMDLTPMINQLVTVEGIYFVFPPKKVTVLSDMPLPQPKPLWYVADTRHALIALGIAAPIEAKEGMGIGVSGYLRYDENGFWLESNNAYLLDTQPITLKFISHLTTDKTGNKVPLNSDKQATTGKVLLALGILGTVYLTQERR